MTRPLFDLQQRVFNAYVFGNITGGTVENHTAKPTIVIEGKFERTPVAYNTNGRIVFVKAEPANNIELGISRHKVWFVDGYIQHENQTIFDDATILSMKAEMERGMNVYNATAATYGNIFVSSLGYNEDPVNAIYDFTIELTQYGVSAIS